MSDETEASKSAKDTTERPARAEKSAAAFRTISEVADELDLPQHVLRFWETKFPQVRPMKRGGGRRYYRPDDVQLLHRVRDLLYVDGYTIKGVQKLMRQSGSVRNFVSETQPHVPLGDSGAAPETAPAITAPTETAWLDEVNGIVADLKGLRQQLLDSAG
jgi:DNA-binding transcriptional MerR regulator